MGEPSAAMSAMHCLWLLLYLAVILPLPVVAPPDDETAGDDPVIGGLW